MKTKVKFERFLAPLFLLIILSAFWPEMATSQGMVRVGLNYPKTGPYSAEGRDQLRAAQMAAEQINAAGGILRHQIEIVIRDSASSVIKTEQNVKELIENDGVRMIFGGASSDVAIKAADLSQQYLIPFFGTLTYSTATTGVDAHRVSFRECYDAWMSAKVMSSYLNQHFNSMKYYYITANYTWGWTTEESLRKLTGTDDEKHHLGVRTPMGNQNFIDELKLVREIKPDVLVLVLFGKDLTNCLRQASVMGVKDICQIIVPNLTLTMASGAGPKAMEGVLGALPWTWQIPAKYKNKKGMQFVKAYASRFNGYPSTASASAYTILFEYKDAVERAGSFKTSKVVQALEGHTYKQLKDPQTWRAFDHQSLQTIFMVKCKPREMVIKDPYQQDYFEIIHSLPGKDTAITFEEWRGDRIKAGKPITLEQFKDE
jgi:ABC-type branched-subunit amino acid transport system substrate-binding protein